MLPNNNINILSMLINHYLPPKLVGSQSCVVVFLFLPSTMTIPIIIWNYSELCNAITIQ
jgi:hypothetical protein